MNEINNPIPSQYQTDNLILLVGTNPLPNYVAARVLWNGKGKVYFLATSETHKIAVRLVRQLGLSAYQIMQNIESSRANQIQETVSEAIKGMVGSIGLNYTGGTKAMGIHAYLAAKASNKGIVFSYLDARSLEMSFDGVGTFRISVGRAVQMGVEDLLKLHGFELKEPFQTQPERLELVYAIWRNLDEWKKWAAKLRDKDNKDNKYKLIKTADAFSNVSIPQFSDFPNDFTRHANLLELANHWGYKNSDKREDLAKWLEGGWLEDFVLDKMQAIAPQCGFNDGAVVSRVETKDPHFELDVVAVRGYQMIVVSCTTADKKDLVKSKLFEVYLRARQIGGEEARVCIVSCAPDSGDSRVDIIEGEATSDLNPSSQIKVFGKEDLPDLDKKLALWINEQPLT
ncbi:MAG TPA: DUF1887 family CARF protein [Anaerolineales bacterium]|nr:DUF1887 family CARF protein [Anaerolineales bacterium]